MITKIYLDIAILSVFFVILIINSIAIILLKEEVNKLIVCIASLLVSIVSCINYLFNQENRLIVVMIMLIFNVIVVYKNRKISLIIRRIIYTFISTMIVQMTIYTLVNITNRYTFLILVSSFLLTFFMLNFIKNRLNKSFESNIIYHVELKYKNNTISLKGMVDTGNSATFNFKSISFMNKKMFVNKLGKEVLENEKSNMFVQDIKTINGTKKVDIIFMDFIKIEYVLNKKRECMYIANPAIGLVDENISNNDFDIILSPKLFL